MSTEDLLLLSQAQRDRLAFVDLRLRFVGEIRRQDLVTRFSIQMAAATRDLTQYKELAVGNLEYDKRGKVYVRSAQFRPLFDFSVERVQTWLSEGYGGSEPHESSSIVPWEGVGLSGKLNLEMLSVLTRAIHQNNAVKISYRSLSSGRTSCEIVPFALANNGLHWHVRAFDRRSGEFCDFVLGRLGDAQILPGPVVPHERSEQDIQWTRIVELELVPHPANVQHPDTIETEYGMTDGVLNIRVRAAMAGYLLRHWDVDCTENHSLKGAEYHLWLRNRQTLYGVSNLILAPGYHGSGED